MRPMGLPQLALGIDIVALSVIERMLKRYGANFLTLVYTPAERCYCGERIAALACLFAAKEAAAKALGVGLAYIAVGGVQLHELEVCAGAGARPMLQLSGGAQTLAMRRGLHAWSLSFACSRRAAVAQVVGYALPEHRLPFATLAE